jgi:hypothetical protein
VTTSSVLMVRPVDFAFNSQTGQDNPYQQPLPLDEQVIQQRALAEFEQAVTDLESFDIRVMVLEKAPTADKAPDAVFPNNWFATDTGGNIYLFPMKTVNRQREVRPKAVSELLQSHGYTVGSTIEVADGELILEGTGAIVFDHQHKLAYGALSERCHEPLLASFSQQIGYKPLGFSTVSSNGTPVYHTNVLMSVGEDFVVACTQAIVSQDRAAFIESVEQSGKQLVDITMAQMEQYYCANILELKNTNAERVLVLSAHAWSGFTQQQQAFFSTRMKICAPNITTIETVGGGSMRCMLAEVFNPYL